IRTSFRHLLERADFTVLEAPDGTKALDQIRQTSVDVVVIDVYMPGGVDGIDVIEQVQKFPGHRPALIAISGEPHFAYRSNLKTAEFAGADVTITKPVNFDELLHHIRMLLLRAGWE